MGQITRFSCDKCGYEAELFLGAGLGSINEMIIERTLNGTDLDNWKKGRESGEIRQSIAENLLCVCEGCKELQMMYQVSCITKQGETKYIRPKCKTCNEERQIVEKWEQKEITCPKCEATMVKQIVGHWD